jgi:threonine dehydrogenase-like Zn-dependent dehydrogenase
MPERTVRGVRQRFAASALNYHALRLGGGRIPRIARGWMPWLGLDRFTLPALPAPDWVRVRPILSGICGSDTGLLTGRFSPLLSPFGSFPAVMGHEVVGTVTEIGPEAGDSWLGTRVVLDPLLGCVTRGLEPCRWCAAGQPSLCLHLAEGRISPAPMLGFCHDIPGGWAEEMVAHVSQLHAVPDALSDEAAVMVEPLSVAMHGVLAHRPEAGERVLVIGAGSIGQCTVASLELLAPEADVAVVARHPAQRAMALRLGAGAVFGDALDAAVERAGATRYAPIVGDDVLTGGFDQVYDCVGSARSLAAAFRATRAGGQVTLLGGPGVLDDVDWTLVWNRELTIAGSYVYGREDTLPGGPHTMDVAMGLLVEHPELPIGDLVTHTFPLEDWRQAMRTALTRGPSAALKVAFTVDRSIQP